MVESKPVTHQDHQEKPVTDFTRIGDAPRPSTSQDLGRRIRDGFLTELIADPGTTVREAEKLRVDVSLQGADVDALHIDASGVVIDVAADTTGVHLPGTEVDDDKETAEVMHREPAVARQATFVARPLRFQDVPLDIEATAVNVPFEWLELDDGGLALKIPEEMTTRSRRAVRLQLSVAVNPDDVVKAIMRFLRTDLAEVDGIHIDREKFTLKQLGPHRFRIGLSARVRWKFLGPTLRTRTELRIDNRFVVRLLRTKITSSNPLLAVVLRVFRRRITQDLKKPIDLNQHLRPLVLRRLHIDADPTRVRVESEAGLI